MRTLHALVVPCGLLFSALAAHAAPTVGAAGAAASARVTPTSPLLATGVVATVIPVDNPCGQRPVGKVQLVNKSQLAAWQGMITFTANGGSQTTQAQLAKGETKVFDLSVTTSVGNTSNTLDCKKPLAAQEIRVVKDVKNPVLVKALKPTKVTQVKNGLPAPPPGDNRVWVRSVLVEATCGGQVKPTAIMMALGPNATTGRDHEAALKLNYGIYTQQLNPAIPPGVATPIPMIVPVPLDCNAPTGLPTFEYSLSSGFQGSGKVDASAVLFE